MTPKYKKVAKLIFDYEKHRDCIYFKTGECVGSGNECVFEVKQ